MKIIDIIKKRRCIREFIDKDVEFYKIAEIIDAGMQAPNAGNLQNWEFIVVKERLKKERIAEASVQQYWMTEAPILIVICAAEERAEKYYGDRGKNLYNIQNCAAAAQNMLLAATSLGLASCWVGAFNEESVKSILDIPKGVSPQIILAIGYSDKEPEKKHMFDIKDLLYFDEWGVAVKNIHTIMGMDPDTLQGALTKSKELLFEIKKKIKKEK